MTKVGCFGRFVARRDWMDDLDQLCSRETVCKNRSFIEEPLCNKFIDLMFRRLSGVLASVSKSELVASMRSGRI